MTLCSSRCARPAVRQASRHALILSTGKVVVLAAAPLQVPPLKSARPVRFFVLCVFRLSLRRSIRFYRKNSQNCDPRLVSFYITRFGRESRRETHQQQHLASGRVLGGGWAVGRKNSMVGKKHSGWELGEKHCGRSPTKFLPTHLAGASSQEPKKLSLVQTCFLPCPRSLWQAHSAFTFAQHNPGIPCRAG